jgi:hypothetical protein
MARPELLSASFGQKAPPLSQNSALHPVDGETAELSNNDPANEFARWAGHAIMANPASKYMEDVMRSGEKWLKKNPDVWHFIEDLPLQIMSGLLPWHEPVPMTPYVPSPKRYVQPPPVVPWTQPKPEGSPIQDPQKQPQPSGPPKIDPPKPGDRPPQVVDIPITAGPEPFIKGFRDFILQSNPDGRPGNALTKESNRILLKACEKAAADRYFIFEHLGGVSRPEQFLRGQWENTTKGGSYPDISFKVAHQNGDIVRVLLNTVTMLKSRNDPTANEQRRLDNLETNAAAPQNTKNGPNRVDQFPKLLSADDKAKKDYEKEAEKHCGKILDSLREQMLDAIVESQSTP